MRSIAAHILFAHSAAAAWSFIRPSDRRVMCVGIAGCQGSNLKSQGTRLPD